MPYITKEQRALLDARDEYPETAGELNYSITKLVLDYVNRLHTPGYQVINDVIGALEGAKMEFYRRFAAPYEDKKIIDNGDVY